MKTKKQTTSGKSRRTKLLAIALTVMLAFHLYGTLFTVSLHSAFAASDTYSVENVVYLNVTSLSKGPGDWEIVRFTVGQSLGGTELSTSATGTTGFLPNATGQRITILDLHEREDLPVGVYNFAGVNMQITADTAFAIGEHYYNGTTLITNVSDFYADTRFSYVPMGSPAEERFMLFDAPQSYAERFCDAGGYTLNNIINSTYTESFDIDTLNAFSSRLVKSDYLILNFTDIGDLSASVEQYGGSLTQDFGLSLGVTLLILAIVGIGCLTWGLVECHRINVASNDRNLERDRVYNATIAGINAERDLQLDLIGEKGEKEATVLAMYENGTITYEECVALLDVIDASYSSLISNRSMNIEQILEDYYANSEAYTHALGIATSWTDYIYAFIILLIVGFVIYFVYVIFLKRSGTGAQGTTNIYPIKLD